ncbi:MULTISPECIES: CBS domain-containing protein [Rhizobium]|jgi:CBS domain-containing protein|uniref:CBS domain-containing protein n=1 Tax=Rhizobium leguminosarum TaxID=384 RepID=A0A6P0D8R6_RHILE|nr:MULTISPECIES: CBS domain-containing protein [Rhizobium]MBB4344491.1 CBS domain-containing protein [Rhizobium leguminosarum]MBB6297563.1 CBS domain-containing protein [Rhizobium leguminosarum]MBY5312473.1 CBS domain-containing protein [Rhizobium leguminosarum]MBY5422248.1 CBS domain-containing protein [Rhizobium leguminosarum]MBY5494670.1 CBS domain-containing protein [Rhizobium leguminosarum]
MSVHAILMEKGCHVVTAYGSDTVKDACHLLHSNHIGAVIIVDRENRIEGIFTERDVVGAIAQRGISCMELQLSEVMWKNVFSCSRTTSINRLMDVMNKHKARHLPVGQDGRLAGIVSIGDAVRHHIRAIEYETEYIRSYIAG